MRELKEKETTPEIHVELGRNIAPLIWKCTILIILSMLIFMAIQFQNPKLLGDKNEPCDFHAFYISGKMFLDGRLNDAYRYESFVKEQDSFFGKHQGFLAWSYPPPFNLITSVLALLPIGAAYLILVGASLASYVFMLKKLSPRHYVWAVFSVLPAIMLNIRVGQNGLLTASLIGFSLLAFIRRNSISGLPLGLMIIKPHLAVGAALMTCMSRRWKTIFIAAITTTLILALSTTVFSASIWPAFFGALDETRKFLWNGDYPLKRMTSIYATLHTFGASPKVAMAAQAASALISCMAVIIAYLKTNNPLHLVGITAIASLYMSPYCYDYDMTLLGIGVAAFIPEISRRAKGLEIALLLSLSWVSCGAIIIAKLVASSSSDEPGLISSISSYSISSLSLTALLIIATRVITRPCHSADEQRVYER